jgi:ABC-type oligopeptide transport system substrate-binding subunit
MRAARPRRLLRPVVAWALAVCLPGPACRSPSGSCFGHLRSGEPSDVLVFNNGAELDTLDPAMVTGQPDARIVSELFDGLTTTDPVTLEPRPSVALSWDVDPTGRSFTFHLRPDARWTDGTPLTADDFVWSWERILNPASTSPYTEALFPLGNARLYHEGRLARLRADESGLAAGTAVEVVGDFAATSLREIDVLTATQGGGLLRRLPAGTLLALADLPEQHEGWTSIRFRTSCPDLSVPSRLISCTGDLIPGWVKSEALSPAIPLFDERLVARPTQLWDEPPADGSTSLPGTSSAVVARPGDVALLLDEQGDWSLVRLALLDRSGWVPAASLVNPRGNILHVKVRPIPEPFAETEAAPGGETRTVSASNLRVKPDLLWLRAEGTDTLKVRLGELAPGFLLQTSLASLRAVPQRALRRWGKHWTDTEHLVTSGPFRLGLRKAHDRVELERDPGWWGADSVKLRRVVAFSLDSGQASVDLYRAGRSDLVLTGEIPVEMVPFLEDKSDFHHDPSLWSCFYRLNTTRRPFDDARVRHALALAIDRDEVAARIGRGYLPSAGFVPAGIAGYASVTGAGFDPAAARALLSEAGFPVNGGPDGSWQAAAFPEFRILYDQGENHRQVAVAVRDQWERNLGIRAEPVVADYATWLDRVRSLDYDVTRAGWVADYVDPQAFLELWQAGSGNNRTGWQSADYDRLLAEAANEPDRARRMELLARAESILLQESPVIPLFTLEWVELRQPSVRGWGSNLLDLHPLRFVSLARP